MSELPWFRMYSEAVDDEKLRLLAFEDRWHFVAIICLKAQGTLDSGAPFLERRIATKLGLQPAQLDEVKRRLMEVALIDDDFQPLAWGRRQFKSDHSAAERKRNQRDRDRQCDSHNDVTTDDCDGHVDGHVLEQSRAEQNRADTPDGLDLSAWDEWIKYRISIRRPLKQASIPAAQRKLAAFGAGQRSAVEQSIANGWQGLFEPKDQQTQKQNNRRGFA